MGTGRVMKVALFKGEFQHDVVNVFVDDLAAAFEELGHQSLVIETASGQAELGRQLQALFEMQGLTALIGFNTLGSTINADGVPLHRALGVPFVSYLLDHPVFHLGRLEPLADQPILCVDLSHVRYLRQLGLATVHHAPHAARPLPEARLRWEDRPHRLLFPGSFAPADEVTDRLRAVLAAREDHALVLPLFEALAGAGPISDDEALIAACADHPLAAPLTARPGINSGYAKVIQCLNLLNRGRVRLDRLTVLDQAGIAVDLVGSGWAAAHFRRHRWQPARPFPDVLTLMGAARFVLNLSPLFAHGLHERLVYGSQAGAVLCTERNGATAALIDQGAAVDLARLPDEIERLDRSPAGAAIAASGQSVVRAEHLWSHRARQILTLIGG